MNDDDAYAFAAAWVDAWNRRDLDAILEHYAADVELTSPLAVRSDGTLRGTAELRDYLDVEFHACPDLHLEVHHTLAGVDGVTIVCSRENGAMIAEVMILDAARRIRRAWAFYHHPVRPDLPPD